MKIEWQYHEETSSQLEQWTTDVRGIRLTIAYLPTMDTYAWRDNRTGHNWQTGYTTDLDIAMSEAVASTLVESTTRETYEVSE